MKEWCKVTFMKEWLKALDLTVILCYRGLLWLFSFSSNGRLKKKCRYKEISFTKSLLLLKGHFQSSFIFPFQCSITRVIFDGLVFIRTEWDTQSIWSKEDDKVNRRYTSNVSTVIFIAMEIDSVFLEIGESGRQQVKYVAVLCLLKVRSGVYNVDST